jgi:cytochrome b561
MVSLHWLVAALTAVELYFGLLVFARGMPGMEHPPVLVALHMLFGMAVLALVVVRFIVRLRMPRPAEVLTGGAVFNWLARLVHYGLYVLLVAVTVVGVVFSVQNGQLQETLLGKPEAGEHEAGHDQSLVPLAAIGAVGPRSVHPHEATGPLVEVHKWLAWGLLGLAALHAAAGLFHQLILRDGLLGRMWFGGGQ